MEFYKMLSSLGKGNIEKDLMHKIKVYEMHITQSKDINGKYNKNVLAYCGERLEIINDNASALYNERLITIGELVRVEERLKQLFKLIDKNF